MRFPPPPTMPSPASSGELLDEKLDGSEREEEEEDVGALAARELRGVSLKRPAPCESGDDADDGDAKRLAPSASTPEQETCTYRVLVSVRRGAALAGAGGAAVKWIRDTTGARVRVLDPRAGCDEQVVEISSALAADTAGEHPAQARPTPYLRT